VPLHVNCFILADGAQEAGGKLYVLGGGWNQVMLPQVPGPLPNLAIAALLGVPWNDTNTPILFELFLVHEDDALDAAPLVSGTLTAGRPPGATPGEEIPIPLAMNLNNLLFEKTGGFAFVLRCNGEELARAKFRVEVTLGLPTQGQR
jgi:hypothetical protein